MRTKIALFLGLSLIGSVALANDYSSNPSATGMYVGAELGGANTDYGGTSYLYSYNSAQDGVFAGRAYAGYSFTEILAAELGYDYLGNIEFKHNPTGNTQDLTQQGLDLVGKATIPLDYGFAFFLKAGGMFVFRSELDSHSNFFKAKDSNTKFVPIGGLGLAYSFDPSWSADVSWTGSVSNGDLPNIYFYGVGLTYRFGTSGS